MASTAPSCRDRVAERRGAVALARHFSEAEGLSIAPYRRTPGSLAGDRDGVFLRPDWPER
jgi:hypothetical protein